MFRRVFLFSFLVFLFMASSISMADEGMWPMDSLDKLPFDRLHKMGLELGPKDIYDPDGGGIARAIVSLGGGTGSFVSPKGLILTNHHVAFSALQRVSTAEHNYIEDGFWAKSFKEEIPAPGYKAYVLISIKDVTKDVLKAVKKRMSDLERYNAIEKRIKKIVARNEKGKDVKCEVISFYDGMKYYLYTYFVIKDVRIVYAPPEAIGNYGSDIDNWMWPRHGGDFSFLRAYVAPDGSSAEYSEENVPYEPEVFLPISTKGVKDGDFTMIIGFPGRTMRYRSSYSIENNQNFSYPYRIKVFSDWIDILRQAAKESEEAAIKVASYDQMLSNSLKNYQGMLEGFKKGHLLERKRAEERAFIEWVNSDKKLRARYGDILPEIAKLYEEYKTFREKSSILAFMRFGCVPLQAASIIYRWSEEKVKKDIDREPGYQERDIPDLKRRLKVIQRSFYEPADRRVLKYFIMLALELPENQRIRAIDEIVAGKPEEEYESTVDAFLDNLYSNTKLKSVDERLRMFELSKDELLKENDSFIEFAAKLTDEFKEMETKAKAFNGAVTKLRPRLIEAYMKWKGGELYPDANSTMRLTYGTVKGYSPRDAVSYYYITSLTGVIEKNTGEAPFNCPKRLLELYEKKDFGGYVDHVINDVPVDFLSTCDITGGNSGSPILNGRGEVIGAAFDGNYESISADYLFNEKLTRAISVDARYILFILDKFSGAQNLLDEMEIR